MELKTALWRNVNLSGVASLIKEMRHVAKTMRIYIKSPTGPTKCFSDTKVDIWISAPVFTTD